MSSDTAPLPVSPLRARMIEDMTVRGFKEDTRRDYVRNVRAFAAFIGRSPDTATAEDLRLYQLHQTQSGLQPPSINSAVSALRFFFTVTLDRPDLARRLTVVPQPRRIPMVLSVEEVTLLLQAASAPKYKAAFATAYGAGLRVSEVVALKVGDIDSERMLLRVERGKGGKSLMGWMAPEWHLCAKLGMQLQRRGPSMTQVTTIGLDLAKRVFQVHGVDAAGAVMLRRQLKRRQMVPFFTKLPSCLIGMEACGTAHHWGRTLRALGHEVRLIPPAYAKAYVRRNKTDPADAEAICEAVSRPSMRFVPIKSEADQAMAAVHRVRERLIAQRTQTINMLRGQMAEFGVVAAKGPQHVKGLVAELVEPESVPEPLRQVLLGLVRLLTALREQIAVLDKQILAWHRANPCSRRLSGIDGFGPILSSALALRVQEPQRFACGRDLSAWIGLAPKQNSSGGKIRLGAISKKGDVYLRRLLINGAQAVLNSKRAKDDPWIARLLQTKPRLVAAVAFANKMARVAWAVMVRGTDFRRAPAAA